MASSLTIAPALGHALVTAQGQAGGYDAIDDRSFWSIGRQEGAVEAAAFEVTQFSGGANMTVDVACNSGHVVVQGDSVTNQGLYVVRPHTVKATLDIATANASNPRVDSVVVQVDDDEHDSGGNTRARVMVLTGTATSGATLDNRTGAPSLPSSALLLADVLVPATDTTISNSQIRDRRKWARGAYANMAGDDGGNLTVTSTSYASVSSSLFSRRVECSGVPLRLLFDARVFHGSANQAVSLAFSQDGTVISDAETGTTAVGAANDIETVRFGVTVTPSAGSHVFEPVWKVAAGTGNVQNSSNVVPRFTIEEIVRQNTANNATTSG